MADRRELVAIITADPKGLDAALANAGRRGRRGGMKLGKELAISVKRGFGTLADLIGLGGVAGILAAGKQVFDFQKRLIRLRQSSREGVGAMAKLEKQLFAVGKARGLDPEELLAGAEKYTELTGNLQGYIERVDQLGVVSGATGSSVEELAVITAHASKAMGVGASEAKAMFDILVRQGQMGSVELRNMASELPGLIATHRKFSKTGVDGIAELGAMMQLGQRGFTTASEAATGYERLMNAITVKAKQLKRYKVNVFDGKGNKRAASDIVRDLAAVKKFKGKGESKLIKLLGSSEAVTFLNAFSATDQETGKTSAELFAELTDRAKASGAIDEGYKIWDESPAKTMASAQAKLAEFFNDTMKNKIQGIASALDTVASALKTVADHWELVLAAFLGGKALSLLGALGGAGGGLAGLLGGGGAAGGGGMLGSAGPVVAAVLAGYATGSYIDKKTGASKAVSDNVLDTGVGNFVLSPLRDTFGAGADNRQAEAEYGGRTLRTRARNKARDEALSRGMAEVGLSPDALSPEQLRSLKQSTYGRIAENDASGLFTQQAADRQMTELVAELRKLRQQMAGGGNPTVNITTDQTLTRRRGS